MYPFVPCIPQGKWALGDTLERAELQGCASVLGGPRWVLPPRPPPCAPRKAWDASVSALTHVIGSPILPLVLIHLAFLLGDLVEDRSLFSEPP